MLLDFGLQAAWTIVRDFMALAANEGATWLLFFLRVETRPKKVL